MLHERYFDNLSREKERKEGAMMKKQFLSMSSPMTLATMKLGSGQFFFFLVQWKNKNKLNSRTHGTSKHEGI
jgi:hypothetical protein